MVNNANVINMINMRRICSVDHKRNLEFCIEVMASLADTLQELLDSGGNLEWGRESLEIMTSLLKNQAVLAKRAMDARCFMDGAKMN